MIIAYILYHYILAYKGVKIIKNKNKKTPSDYGMYFDEFEVTTPDDKKLKGWYIHGREDSGTVLICHNTNGNKEKFLIYAKFLNQSGMSIYMFDFRSHGDSDYAGSRVMHKIRVDVDAVLDYILKEKANKVNCSIGVYGFSLGTYACLHVAKRQEISCIIMDSGPALDLDKAFDNLYSRTINTRMPKSKVLIKYMLKFILDARDSDVKKAIEAVRDIDKPILFIHGDRDTFITPGDTQRLFEISRSANKEYVLVEGSHHLTNYLYLRDKYTDLVVGFLKKFSGTRRC